MDLNFYKVNDCCKTYGGGVVKSLQVVSSRPWIIMDIRYIYHQGWVSESGSGVKTQARAESRAKCKGAKSKEINFWGRDVLFGTSPPPCHTWSGFISDILF